jgi:glycosyltransferase involved in cell wall biosynthesis
MISYTITACNEDKDLEKLLNVLRTYIKDEDEIILQLDKENTTEEVRNISSIYKERIPSLNVIEFSLNGDFASFKNNLRTHSTKKWIFNIDADEIPSGFLIENLNTILSENDELDVLIVPRWNVVDGITQEHINKWRWRFDDLGRINWPDWQMRIYKNKEQIRWKNKVHEVLEGFEKYAMLPEDKDYCLFHNKTIQRQEKQNDFYNTIG